MMKKDHKFLYEHDGKDFWGATCNCGWEVTGRSREVIIGQSAHHSRNANGSWARDAA
jgi:hypothetical protein